MLRILAAIVVGLAAGAAAALWPMFQPVDASIKTTGGWGYSEFTGDAKADLATRAYVALVGIWALSPRETIYVTTERDDAGALLSAACRYRIEGRAFDSRWWSLTAYKDNHFIPNPRDRYSWSKTSLPPTEDGSWTVILAPEEQAGNWLPSGGGEGRIVLTLRFYNPDPDFAANLARASFPTVTKEGC